MTSQTIATYQAAIKTHQIACDHLSRLLKAKYGKRAGDMRYRQAETVEIADAMRAKLDASEAQQNAWLATMRGVVECTSPDFSGDRCRNCGLGNDAHITIR